MPPWGARRVQPNASESVPAIAEPTMFEGITRSGPAVKGISSSVIKEALVWFSRPVRCPRYRSTHAGGYHRAEQDGVGGYDARPHKISGYTTSSRMPCTG